LKNSGKARSKEVKVFTADKGVTLAAFLKEKLGLSASMIKEGLDLGACRVSGLLERFGTRKLAAGEKVEVDIAFESRIEMNKPLKVDVLYEDNELCIINKPAGLTVEAVSIKKFLGPGYYLVHRLDKATSGALCLAKSRQVQEKMELAFKQRCISKAYIAVSWGVFQGKERRIQTHLAPSGKFAGQTLYASNSGAAANAITHVKKLKACGKVVSFLCTIATGKTHQIRVHLKEMGCPIIADVLYGRQAPYPLEVKRMLLHSYQLGFSHPISGEKVEVTAPISKSFKPFL
jgi:23S rRNA pseudouridine955/2504/2580 synthase